ncbi:hypothetical protein Axi01nite_94920 [Actinoplanes xinjiangensis]|nr:hypothetical protein Axi01nite_94920 [Actinoplanes xinjiangensis]
MPVLLLPAEAVLHLSGRIGHHRDFAGALIYYQALCRGIDHQATLRQRGSRLVGILHGCLKTGTDYAETTAWLICSSPLDIEKHGMPAVVRAR